jgi:putative tRNA adenosine deaminase-associated protein
MADDSVDFAISAWREDGRWQCEALPPRTHESLDGLVAALRAHPGEVGTLGLVSVAEEFFILIRMRGEEVRLLVSDLFSAEEYDLGIEALDRLAVPAPDDEDDEEILPAGDLRILEDLGLRMDELEFILDDPEAWPDELLSTITTRVGFGEQFTRIVDKLTR